MTDFVCNDPLTLARKAASDLDQTIASLQAEGSPVRLALTGGTIANRVYEHCGGPAADWTAVEYYWGDERFVRTDSEDRNERQAREALLDRVTVPVNSVHPMPSTDEGLSLEEAAAHYGSIIPEVFDIVLLGLGPDGHIASLFPGFEQVQNTAESCVPVPDSPKPPPERLSLTLPALNRANQIWFLVSGREKAEAVAAARGDTLTRHTPAQGARGRQATHWYLDTGAAELL